MSDLIVMPDVIAPTITFLRAIDEITALLDDRIATQLPQQEAWPALRIDPTGGVTPVEYRIDQQQLQFQCFDLTDVGAARVARTVRAGVYAMNGLHLPGVLVIADVTTSGITFIEGSARDAKLLRTPPISHATFSSTITVRPDP